MGTSGRRIGVIGLLVSLLVIGSSCKDNLADGKIHSAGLLVVDTINDQVWGTMGYKGLLAIGSSLDVEVYCKEGIKSEVQVAHAVEEFKAKGVNFVIGNGNIYAEMFNRLSKRYPDVHFLSVNGDAKNPNTTSVKFNGYAMGYLGGIVAAEMSKTNHVGVVAAYEFQPEVKGFVDGARYRNPEVSATIRYVDDWDSTDRAVGYAKELADKGVDVFYPAGDGFNIPIIEEVKERGLYVIGYVSEQRKQGDAVLTSTVQHVDKLLSIAAEQYDEGMLQSGNLCYDFQNNVITMGTYSSLVPKDFQETMDRYVEAYKRTGELPGKE
ncbi:MAG: BMP family ABC transporter substrate-binding protein [Bacillus sp. (in: firmicutes)]